MEKIGVAAAIECEQIEQPAADLTLLLIDDRHVSEAKPRRISRQPVLEPVLVVPEAPDRARATGEERHTRRRLPRDLPRIA
jgi:hypothetical protein